MAPPDPIQQAAAGVSAHRRFRVEGKAARRLCVYNGGFLKDRHIRRILALAGLQVSLGLPRAGDAVGVWGKSPTSGRGETVARRWGASAIRIEDALLRSLHPGRSGGGSPLGLFVDSQGVHFDSAQPSDLETLLARAPLDDSALLARAKAAMDRLQREEISKYNAFDPALPVPDPGYVLVIDQTRGDAAIRHAGASAATFAQMLVAARVAHPGARIVIKTHPETQSGQRAGHFGAADASGKVSLLTTPVSPWRLLEGAIAVYTVSSGMGFEAILAGHKPNVFGQPFYAGWGLSHDETPVARRGRNLTRAQLFAGAMMLYPLWYDPFLDQLCQIERVIDILAAEARAWREDQPGYDAFGMRLWKRPTIRRFFGQHGRLRFVATPHNDRGRLMAWAGKVETLPPEVPVIRVEDGFVRSKGLGAELVPPLSLVRDDLGIYYDPRRESRLERLIAESGTLPPAARDRAQALLDNVLAAGLSKYNVGTARLPDLPEGHRILVPGQVEDDASIRLGCTGIATNLALLKAARAANPQAVILYKPHPDVEAGLRTGAVPDALDFADLVVGGTDPIALIAQVDEVWTLTSLLGFEALLRGRAVTCFGVPFYAGWGLTQDRGDVPARRVARVDLVGLVYAVLIGYPRYVDPVTGRACPPEVVLHRLAHGPLPRLGPANRALSKLQGLFASFGPFWR